MATNSSSPNVNPKPASSPKPDNSRQRLIAIAAVIIVALLGINAFLLISYNKRSKMNKQLTYQLDESEQLKAELEKQYYEALSELEEMRGSNEELNALIEQQKTDLKDSKDRIDRLLRDNGNLKRAREELNAMKGQVEQYVVEINQLRQEVEELNLQNNQLSESNQLLNTDLESQRTANQELSTAQAALVSEKTELEQQNQTLSQKVNIASVVKVQNVEITGMKMKSSGKAVKKNYAKNIDQLQICFNTTANQVAEMGTEEFLIRVINPLGETLAIEELGSGTFVNNATGEEIRFTQMKDLDYNQEAGSLCTTWSPNQPFSQGEYAVEIYNKGYMAGNGSFRLK